MSHYTRRTQVEKVRSWHGLPTLPYLGQQLAHIHDNSNLAYI